MSSRSIVDRVLLFAAAICTAGLVWQLTVLMTAKGQALSSHRTETAAAAPAQPRPAEPTRSVAEAAPAAAPAPVSPAIRVVYADGSSPKMVGKATDMPEGTPMALASPALMRDVSKPAISPAVAPLPAQPVSAPVPAPAAVPSQPAQAVAPLAAPASTPPDDAAEPEVADAVPPSAPAKVASLTPAVAAKPAPETDGRPASKQGININRASIDALNRLPGGGRIGQTIARHRPYRSVEDLLTKRVLRRGVYEQIKGQLAAD